MDVIYGLIPGMIFLGLVAVVIFFWAARSGQFDDMDGPAHRILMDEDDPNLPQNRAKRESPDGSPEDEKRDHTPD